MKCPHCLVEFTENAIKQSPQGIPDANNCYWILRVQTCPNESCQKAIVKLKTEQQKKGSPGVTTEEFLVYPRRTSRTPLPKIVPDEFAEDYKEACLVLQDSPKASAALSRRCLQHLLVEKAGVKPKDDLSSQIGSVMPNLPSHLSDMIDGIRVIGNFAAHPLKSTNSGEIMDVEPGEAEHSLDTLEELFDHYLVKPERIKEKRAAINAKLLEAGKPPMK